MSGSFSPNFFVQESSNTIGLRNGANSQTLNLYSTYTDNLNYERASLSFTAGTTKIINQAAGTGSTRNIEISANSTLLLSAGLGTVIIRRAGLVSTTFNTLGQAIFGVGQGSALGQMSVYVPVATYKGFVTRLATSQIANAFEIQNSSGIAQLAIDSTGRNFVLDTTIGTKIGTNTTTEKLGFFNATPIVQPTAVSSSQGIATALSNLGLLAVSTIANVVPFSSKSANYTITSADNTVEVIASATITLPTAIGATGTKYQILNCSATNVTVTTISSQTIGNLTAGNPTNLVLAAGEVLRVISNDSNWRII